MWFSKKQAVPPTAPKPVVNDPGARDTSTKSKGDRAESAAQAYLEKAGLKLVRRNFKTPGRGGGEIDLIMREPDGTLVFVEVRSRSSAQHGGAAASVGWVKQRRIVLAARHFLLQLGSEPPCRFDVVLVQAAPVPAQAPGWAPHVEWLRAAFDTSAAF